MLKVRLSAANDCYFVLMKHLGSKLSSRKVKCLIYRTLITPVLIQGCMTWSRGKQTSRILFGTLTGKCYDKYLAWYLKMDVGGGAKTLKYVFYYEYDVKCRLTWAGHVLRMEECDPAKKVCCSKAGGKADRGRTQLR